MTLYSVYYGDKLYGVFDSFVVAVRKSKLHKNSKIIRSYLNVPCQNQDVTIPQDSIV